MKTGQKPAHTEQLTGQPTATELPVEPAILCPDTRQGLLEIVERVNSIAGAGDTESLLSGMLDLMLETCQARTAIFYRYEPKTDELVISATRGESEAQSLVGVRIRKQVGIVGATLSGAQPVIVGDLPGDTSWINLLADQVDSALKNEIVLPLLIHEQIIGVVQLFNYNRLELDLLLMMGRRLAAEVERSTTLSRLTLTNSRQKALIEILGQVQGTMDRSTLLRRVTESASQLVGAERSSIFLVNPKTNDLEVQVSYQSPEDAENQRGKVHRGSRSGKIGDLAGLSPPGLEDWRTAASSTRFGIVTRTAINVPLYRKLALETEIESEKSSILGGLMAFNKNGGSFDDEDAHLLETLADQSSTILQVADLYERANGLFLDVIKALATAIDAKDPYTQGHSLRVSDLSVAMAQIIGLSEEEINHIRISSMLHDIGKIGIPDAILNKSGRLTSFEFDQIKKHPSIGKNIMQQVRVLEQVLPGIVEHHERLNGSGYPHGLRGDQISLMGRIVAVADVFDAMTTNRPYRRSIHSQDTLTYLTRNTSILFDRQCVEALVELLRG